MNVCCFDRLSYRQRIAEVVPEQFDCFVPHKPEPIYKYANADASDIPGADAAHQLENVIRAKGTGNEVLQVLNELPNPLRENDETDPPYNPLQIQVFVQTLLHLGSKSFSHAFAGISKFLKVISYCCQSYEYSYDIQLLNCWSCRSLLLGSVSVQLMYIKFKALSNLLSGKFWPRPEQMGVHSIRKNPASLSA
nr:nuclear cap-binding protein subunit 1-like isoform X2 [Cherax quadricarinatus]